MFKRKYIHIILVLILLFNLTAFGCSSNKSSNTSNTKTIEKTIKGNISSSGEKIYHVPGGQFYDVTKAEEWFATEEEAQAAGYRKSKK